MLGKLFNNRADDSVVNGKLHGLKISDINHKEALPSPSNADTHHSNPEVYGTNDDSYTRTVLYGTPNNIQLKFMEPYNFRLIIVHDKGEIMMKNNYQVHFDSTENSFKSTANRKLLNKHEINELSELMFGNPINQDLNKSTVIKLQSLPPLPDLKNSILLTKIFYLKRKYKFGIGLVIPINYNNISKTLLPNWDSIKHYLTLLTHIFIDHFTSKQVNLQQQQQSSLCSNNNFCTSNKYLEIVSFFKMFIKSINCLTNIPRLFIGSIKFDSILKNWCFELNNWIEVKDGGRLGFNGSKFLNTLLSIMLTIRNQIVDREFNKDELVRVIIMASNPVIAQKLIFIISGVLPYKLKFKTKVVSSATSTTASNDNSVTIKDTKDKVVKLKEISISNSNSFSSSPLRSPQQGLNMNIKRNTPPTSSMMSKGWEIPTTPSRTTATVMATPSLNNTIIQPNSLSNSSSMQYLSSSLSSSSTFSSSLSRGFQLLQSWKSSMEAPGGMGNNTNSRMASPNNEYDEYPWSNNNSTSSSASIMTNRSTNNLDNYSSSLGNNKDGYSFGSGGNNGNGLIIGNKHMKRYSLSELPTIDRNATTLFRIETDSSRAIDQLKCDSVMKLSVLDTKLAFDRGKNVAVLDIKLPVVGGAQKEADREQEQEQGPEEEEDDFSDDYFHHDLPPLCGYVHEFLPDFQLQACPLSQEMDSRILGAMKSDLNSVKVSRSIIVSLRAREIKEVSLTRNKHNEYKPCVKKLYFNGRPVASHLDREALAKVDSLISLVTTIAAKEEASEPGYDEIAQLLASL